MVICYVELTVNWARLFWSTGTRESPVPIDSEVIKLNVLHVHQIYDQLCAYRYSI